MPQKIKVAIVGCGAIAELGHLPSLAGHPDAEVTVLVDSNPARSRQLAEKFGVPKTQDSVAGLEALADAAIIATPPSSHLPLSSALMRAGVDVLVEKPLANTHEECLEMDRVAAETGRVCGVGMLRRFYWADRHVRQVIQTGLYGPLRSFVAENGYPFEWPSASRFILSKAEAGGGVLMGLGSHMLDTLFWWLGEPENFTFRSDAHGGMDSECLVEMTMRCGARGTLELSRSRQLANSYVLEFEHATLKLPLYGNVIETRLKGSPYLVRDTVTPASDPLAQVDDFQPLRDQFADFAAAIRSRGTPMSTVPQVARTIGFIGRCYAAAQPYPMEWIKPIELPAA